MRLGGLTYLTDQIVTFGFSSLELRNKAAQCLKIHILNLLHLETVYSFISYYQRIGL